MKKNISFIILICCSVSFIISGCKKTTSTEITPAVSEVISSTEYEQIIPEAESEPEPEVVVEPIIEAQYPINRVLTDYVGNRAWVQYKTDNDYYYGLIDNNGFLIYSIDYTSLSEWNDIRAHSSLDGTYCLYSVGGYNGPGKGLIIVDSLGKTVFNSNSQSDEADFYYLGYGDNSYLAIKHVANFSQNGFYFCEISDDGEMVNEIEWPEEGIDKYDKGSGIIGVHHFNPSFYYVGNGVFCGEQDTGTNHHIWYYDKINKNFYSSNSKYSKDLKALDIIQENHIIFQGYDGFISANLEDYYYVFDLNTVHDSATKLDAEGNGIRIEGNYGEELINSSEGIFNFDGSLIHSYPEDWNIKSAGAFSGGYAFLRLIGADKCTYVTVVNRDGETQYEPIKETEYCGYWNGYILLKENEEYYIITPSGEKSDLSILKQLGNDFSFNGNYTCCEGFMKINYDNNLKADTAFKDLNDNVINTVFIVSNYDEVKDKNWLNGIEQNEENESTIKDYSYVSNFTIEGKWKNIGNDTYGQAQKGAIIVFDGINCNFFSPSDTYAFYENGDWYKLDCTSPLADTVSFTVKTIDDNHIDIFYSGGTVELERVK